MKKKFFITIFTPTYNRSNLLERLYESIKRNSSFLDFEWIIVDDGSTDNTKQIVENWIAENKIPIRYYFQENSGKHLAINKGVKEAKGELFFIVDSDDWLADNALEKIYKIWMSISDEEKSKLAGICGLCAYRDGRIVGTKFPFDLMVSDSIEIRTFYDVKGDKSEVFRTDILKEFPFPNIKGFVTEALIWNRIAKKYKMLFVNDVWVYVEYQQDGLTAKSLELRVKNIDITILYYKEFYEITNKRIKFKYKLKALINYWRFVLHKKKLPKNLKLKTNTFDKLFSLFLFLIAFIFYFIDRLKLKKNAKK